MGKRKRHPLNVLSVFNTISTTTKHAERQMEKSFMEETERQKVDRLYRRPGMDFLASQLGLGFAADNNFRASKPKLSQTTMLF